MNDAGYSESRGLAMAKAHRWVPYETFVSFIRQIMLEPPNKKSRFDEVRSVLKDLNGYEAPFAANRRFPLDAVYVCIDRPPLCFPLLKVSHGLALEGCSADLTAACHEVYAGAREALELLAYKSDETLLYTCYTFESKFSLYWIDPSDKY